MDITCSVACRCNGWGAGLTIKKSQVWHAAIPLFLGKLFTHVSVSPNSIIWYLPKGGTTGLWKVKEQVWTEHVSCRPTAWRQGSAAAHRHYVLCCHLHWVMAVPLPAECRFGLAVMCWTRLTLLLYAGWVTVLGWVNHLGTEPSTQVDSAWAISLWVDKNEYWLWLRSLLGKNGKSCITVSPVTRTDGILVYNRLKALAVNRAGRRKLYAGLFGVILPQLIVS